MTEKRKVTFILEGHPDVVSSMVHECNKLKSEGNRQVKLDVTMTTEPIYEFEEDTEE